MGNSLRCCLACVLPCGALDVIRIVHLNGHVEEITRPISAKEVLDANPNHILSKPCSQGVVRRILILSPESDLKRGNIYFLIPASSLPDKKIGGNKPKKAGSLNKKCKSKKMTKISAAESAHAQELSHHELPHHLSEVLSEAKFSRRDRRNGGGRVWKPHLDSISEDS